MHEGEISSVRVRAKPAAGGTETVQIDADEDREILGWEWNAQGLQQGGSVTVFSEAFVGVDPDTAQNSAEDLGGKLYTNARWVTDSTNGFATNSVHSSSVDTDDTYDWNEDVTLTLVTQENSGVNSGGAELTIYYREAHDGL